VEGVEGRTEKQQTVELDFTETQLTEAIAECAEGNGWTVKRQPTVDVTRPDLTIAPTPELTLVVEVRLEVGPIHFASLGQVSTYRRALATVIQVPVYPVLITTGEVSEEIGALAEELYVHLIFASGDALESAADSALEGLERLVPALEQEPRRGPPPSSKEDDHILQLLYGYLERGEGREEIAQALDLGWKELAGYYTQLLTKLEATEPEHLDMVMNAWSERAE
jgi:hypothetical protein